jgi:hypothetical protein
MPFSSCLLIVGLFLSAARARPGVAGWVFLRWIGSALAPIRVLAASLIGALIPVLKALDCVIARNLAILSAMAFVGRDTPFGGFAVLLLAAVLPWSGGNIRMVQRLVGAEKDRPPLDEAAFEASLGAVADTELRQRANQFRDSLADPALPPRQQQDARRQMAICYRLLDRRRAQRSIRPRPKTP